MARIYSNQGLIMNQSNTNGYFRTYACARNNSGPILRFTFGAGNPPIHMNFHMHMAFDQTNGSFDFNNARWQREGLYVDTAGNISNSWSGAWWSGGNAGFGWNLSNRQADLWIGSSTTGGFPGKGSISLDMFCDRWDYVTITNL